MKHVSKLFNVLIILAIFGFSLSYIFIIRDIQIKNNNNSTTKETIIIQDFQMIRNMRHQKLYVYSAFFSTNSTSGEGFVTIVAGLKTNDQQPLLCKFYSENGSHYLSVHAELIPVAPKDNPGLPYIPYFIICNTIFSDSNRLPTLVSVVDPENIESDERSSNLMKIIYRDGSQEKYNFSLCVQPTYNYENPLRFAEFVEFYKLMGAEKFTFYNESIGPQTSCLIESYGDLIEILPWSCPYEPGKEIHYHAQLIGQNECLQRYKGVSKYLVIADLDELIMPTALVGNNYVEMIESLNKYLVEQNHSVEEISGYSFRNAFFFGDSDLKYSKDEPSPKDYGIYNNLQTTKKVFRERILEPHGTRSKYIVVPEKVVQVAIHLIEESIGNAYPALIPKSMAFTHHYRDCNVDIGHGIHFNWCEKREKVIDNSAVRFAKEIASRITSVFSSKAKHCHIANNFIILK